MKSIVEMLFYRAELMSDKISIIDKDRTITFGELLDETLKYATLLKDLGVQHGHYVLNQAVQNSSFIARTLAIHLVGACAVPFEHNCPTNRIKELAEITNATVIFSDNKSDMPCKWLDINSNIENHASNKEIQWIYPKEEWIGDLLFTTGTTGKSKGVMISHRAIVTAVDNVKNMIGLSEDEIAIVPTPLNHTHALRRTYVSIMCGSTTILMDGVANLKRLFSYMDEYKVTGIFLMPAMLSYILKLSGDKLKQFKDNINFLELGSSPLGDEERINIMSMLSKSKIIFDYGATESGCTCGYDMKKDGYIPFCIGRPSKTAKFEFADEAGNLFVATKDNPG